MKNAFNLILICFIATLAINPVFSNNGIENENESISMINNEILSFSSEMINKTYFESTSYVQEGKYLSIKTKKNVELIQIMTEAGNLEFQLPINSDQILIAMDDFENGVYEVNLKFENEDTFVNSEMIKK